MCLAIYLASQFELPLIDWDEKNPAFYAKLTGSRDAGVKRQFRWPNIIYLGAAEGCGCGFILDGAEPEKLPQIRADRQKLVDYVRVALQSDPALQIFGCWEGDQEMSPTRTVRISLKDLSTYEFEMNERILVDGITGEV